MHEASDFVSVGCQRCTKTSITVVSFFVCQRSIQKRFFWSLSACDAVFMCCLELQRLGDTFFHNADGN